MMTDASVISGDPWTQGSSGCSSPTAWHAGPRASPRYSSCCMSSMCCAPMRFSSVGSPACRCWQRSRLHPGLQARRPLEPQALRAAHLRLLRPVPAGRGRGERNAAARARFCHRRAARDGEPARKALIVDLAEPGARGRAVGVYYLARGLAVFPAALVGGWLWSIGPRWPFYAAFLVGTAGALIYAVLGSEGNRRPDNIQRGALR